MYDDDSDELPSPDGFPLAPRSQEAWLIANLATEFASKASKLAAAARLLDEIGRDRKRLLIAELAAELPELRDAIVATYTDLIALKDPP